MRAKKFSLFSATLSASIVAHGLLIILVSLHAVPAGESIAVQPPEQFLTLVSIGLRETPQSAKRPVPASAPVTVSDAVPSEDLAAAEEIAEFAERTDGMEGGGGDALSPAAAGEYSRRNYLYIQRRIRDKLTYPPQARRAGIQGTTEVGFVIHADGSVSGVRVRASSGHAILDEEAVAAVFAAAPFPKPPASARIAIPVSFKLR
ncbi:MAG: TonB family protein [Spirochaetota bacterium]|nr:TonB family protein [Spirochaetota bacterium]